VMSLCAGRRGLRALILALATSSCATAAGLAMAAASRAASAADDPLQTADCRSALADLQTQEIAADAGSRSSAEAGASARPTPSGELLAARKRAARRCLASRADPAPPPGRLIQPPIVVAPLAAAPVAVPRSARKGSPLPAAPAAERPYAVTSCDPGGCWANDGSRLNRVGPNLWGSRGVCSLQGTLLQCP
jgi:hypothetical protein